MEEGYHPTGRGVGTYHLHDNVERNLEIFRLMNSETIITDEGYKLEPTGDGWFTECDNKHEVVNNNPNLAQAFNFKVRTIGGIPV